MPTENPSGSAAPVDNSPSLLSFVGDMHGDYRDSAEPESTETGAPPVQTPETTASSEGTEGSAPAGDTPAEADSTAVPDTSTQATPDTDPFEGSAPLGYTVNGESRSFDGITVLKEGGGIIDPEAMERVQRIFGERDHLFDRNREQYAQLSALDSIATWTPPGSQTPVTGRAGVEALHASRAELLAEVQAYQSLLSNPENLRQILAVNEDGSLAWNDLATKNFMLELDRTKGNVKQAVAAHFAKLASSPAAVQPAAQAFDPKASAPAIVEFAIKSASIAGLTDADKQWAQGLAPRFVRTATQADAPAFRVGEPILEPEFVALLEERASRNTATAKTVASASDVAKANAARIAAAKVGGKGALNAPKITPQKTTEPTRADDFDSAWDRNEKASAGALRAQVAPR